MAHPALQPVHSFKIVSHLNTMNRLERLLGISDIACLNELLSSSEIGVYHFKHLLHLTKSSIFFLSKSFYILSDIHSKTATNFRKTYKER